jgi:serine/threonine protein kinase
LLRTARNLARAVRSVHSRGYVIGDVNESNVLVADDAIVTLVDTDSFQVNDGTTVYRCTVGKPEYTPPELQGMSFRDVDRSVEHDLFGLGVLIYQLLMEGTHPFGGVFTGQGEAPELQDRIKAGHFPHGRRRVPYKPMPLAPTFQMLPVALQELFLLCFEQGHGNPAARPTAEVWSKALGEAEDGLVTCGVNGQHHYSDHLGVCPWCERAAKLGGRDPFPALGAISSGQHLKPAAIGKAVGKPILKANPKPPASKASTPNPVPNPVITLQAVSVTPQTPSQPQASSQLSIPSNLVNGNSQISSSSTTSATKSVANASYWKRQGITIGIILILITFFAIVQFNPFANQANKARQAEAKSYVSSMNKLQQIYYLENNQWAKNMDDIRLNGLNIKSESENYHYNTQLIDSIKIVNIKNYSGIAIQIGTPKKEGLKSYLGVTYLHSTSDTPLEILCESNEPTTKRPGFLNFGGKAIQCPDGYKLINRF